MEALNVLRIEKGFITHAEIHGRTTAYDIGMERMVSGKKDCVGKTLSERPGLTEAGRERLIGLRPIGESRQLLAGAHLYREEARPRAENGEGYLTSVCYSPTLGSMIGLGFLKDGPGRLGEVVKMVDGLRGVTTLCEVVNPVFFDPGGGRMRG